METLLAFGLAPQKIHFNIPPWLFWAMWLGILALFVLMLYAKSRETRKRQEALERLGMEIGFSYSEKAPDVLAAELSQIHFNIPQVEYQPRYTNVLEGSAGGGDAVVADRTVGSGKNQSTSTVFAFNLKTPLPRFTLSPESIVWRVAEKLGYSDIDIDGAPDFSRRFFLHGEDKDAVRALFKPEVTQVFEALDPKTNLYVSASGPWLVVYRPGRLIAADKVREFLRQSELLANAFRRSRSSSVFG